MIIILIIVIVFTVIAMEDLHITWEASCMSSRIHLENGKDSLHGEVIYLM